MSIQDHHRESASISLSSNMGLDVPSLDPPMSSIENPPQLALSDIMHHMSPSPVPAEDSRPAEDSEMAGSYSNGSRRERQGSPEPLTEADIVAMRRRLHALGFSLDRHWNELSTGEDITRHADDFGNATLRERELANMVLRLMDPLPVDSTQLERQAGLISVLTSQRDFLVHQAEEDRDRWRSEREGWDRMAEALLSQRNTTGKAATKEDETERQKLQLESENRVLRDKLRDTQNRLSSLESELMKLKPLLLMQPYSVAHLRQNLASQLQASSQPPSTPLTIGHRLSDVRPKGKQRESDSASSRTQLEAISEDFGTNDERGLGSSSLARSSLPGSSTPSTNMPIRSGTKYSTADIYRRSEPLSRNPYSYNYHYSTPSTSPSKSTLIPPKITVDSPPSSSKSQTQPRIIAGSTSQSAGSTIPPTTSSQSHPLPQGRPRSRDYASPAGTPHNATIRRGKHGIAPLTSDARIEHVLLAARRIGRERAGLVAGILQHVERETDIHNRELELMKARQDLERSEKERLERLANGTSGLAYYRSTDVLTSPQQRNSGKGSTPASVPKTPKRGGGVGATHYPGLSGALNNSPTSSPTRAPASAGPSTFVFVNTSPAPGTLGYSGGGVLSTPGQLGTIPKGGGTASGGSRNVPSNPPTPLDSLLDAARSMMADGAGAVGKAGEEMNGTRKALEHPESPVPKRRRVSSGGSKMVGRGGSMVVASTGSKVTRVRSGLDVLADQAAAASDEPGETRRRRSNSGGKGKERILDEGLGRKDDGEADIIVHEGDDVVDRPDDSWLRGSIAASASSMSPSRGRGKAKTTSISIAEPKSTSSMSLRPVRQASHKRLASQDLQPPPSVSTTTTSRGKGKSRGRPKGSKTTSRMNPSLGPRVIASAPVYSPLEEAIALQSQKDRTLEKEQFQETMANLDSSSVGRHDVGGDEASLVATEGREHNAVDGVIAVEAGDDNVTTGSPLDDDETEPVSKEDAETQINTTTSNAPTNGHVSPADVDLMTLTIPPVHEAGTDVNAEAELDDEDAEGEEEENNENVVDQGRLSRSRSRPLPDPVHLAPSDSNDPDADADAEGEMEFEEPSSGLHLSVPIGKFDGSFWTTMSG